jgi:hypothetical protein
MAKLDTSSTLKRLRNRYRLVVMNEDTYEEVVKFRLSRMSVYIVFSGLLVVFIALTMAIILFTPIKYYLPGAGYGDVKQVREYRALKIKTDSIENAMMQQEQFIKGVKKMLTGEAVKLDTTVLELPKVENDGD